MIESGKPPVTRKAQLDPMLRRLGIKIPYLRFKFTTPTPDEIRSARIAAGLTQAQAAESVGLGAAGNMRWSEYENGTRTPDVARWTLFQLIIRIHPEWRLKRNKHAHLMRPK